MNVRKIKNFIKIILGIPKSLVFNVTKFGLIEGIKLPIIVSNNTILKDISGEIILKNPKTFGVRIGFGSTDNYSWKHEKTIFKNRGQLVFEGKAKLGFGSVISNSGYLNIGNNFSISCKGSSPSKNNFSSHSLSIIFTLGEFIENIISLVLSSPFPTATTNSSTIGSIDSIDAFIGK